MQARQMDYVTYHEVDEIDHITMRHHNGKGLERTKAMTMIRYYAWRLPKIKALFPVPNPITGDFAMLTDAELVARLLAARTLLMRRVFPESALLKEQEDALH